MKKQEFLKKLEWALECLPYEERESALRYYDEYISDAGEENEEATIRELNSPEEVAKSIIDDYKQSRQSCCNDANSSTIDDGFSAVNVKVMNASIELIKSEKFSVDYDADSDGPTRITHRLSDGTLYVEEKKTGIFSFMSFMGNSHKRRVVITVPDCMLKNVRLVTVNGRVFASDIKAALFNAETVNGSVNIEKIVAEQAKAEAVNGSVNVENVISKQTNAETVNGNVRLSGLLKGNVRVSSVNGSIRIYTRNGRDDYDYSLSTVNGSVRIGTEKMGKRYKTEYGRANIIRGDTVSGGISVEFE